MKRKRRRRTEDKCNKDREMLSFKDGDTRRQESREWRVEMKERRVERVDKS